jgi:hypothetical protein
VSKAASKARSGEFFAPLPLAALALTVVNDVWLKPAFHSALTGKLSDVGICFFMPLFLSDLLGILLGLPGRFRLWAGALLTTAIYTAQELIPPSTRFALSILRAVGPRIGIHGVFELTSDWTDLLCLLLVPLAVIYGKRRVADGVRFVDRRAKGDPEESAILLKSVARSLAPDAQTRPSGPSLAASVSADATH